jgi:DNA helicase-2/ATP-dependent DNA helicase PcrA
LGLLKSSSPAKMKNDNYLSELNEVQRQAVLCTQGPVMIIAGAGSGKTRVLTYRVAHLIQNGVDPFNILSLTFTNKAAREMKDRIAKIVGTGAKNLWMGTFHSVFARILRVEADKIGYPKNFTIYDTEDSKGLLKDIIKELGLDDKIYKPSLVYNRISAAKNMLISAQAYNLNDRITDEDKMSKKPQIGEIYSKYSNRCFKAGAMDFDDLLFKTNVLLRDFPDVLQKYQEKFKYILVDEYQDTNFSQYVIVKQLAARFENICVVGDDAQSIYAFRGANIQNILNFEKDYSDLKTFKLEQNYRSTKTIVGAANSIIANNKEQLDKKVWTDNVHGEKIRVMRALTDNEEGQQVASSIFETRANNQSRNDEFAILYRTNAQSRAMEEALRKLNVPYRIYGGLSFYHRKEIKDLLAYFRLAINPHDEESLKRIINYPARGIGQTTVDKLMVAASDNDVSIWTAIDNINDFNLDINAGTANKINDFAAMIKSYGVMVADKNAFDVGNHIANTSGILRELYNDKTPEGVSRYENIQELLNGLKEFVEEEEEKVGNEQLAIGKKEEEKSKEESQKSEGGITEENQESRAKSQELTAEPEQDLTSQVSGLKSLDLFMQDIALLTDADKKTEGEEDRNRVSLMTIHSAKGLEFPYVHIVGLEENLFPSQMALNSREELEEERRLFYVALTRAEKSVTLSYAVTRYRWGNLINCEPSRFIEELAEEHVEMPAVPNREHEDTWGIETKPFVKKYKTQQVSTPKPVTPKNLTKINRAGGGDYNPETLKDLQPGMEVQHERFGTGKVIAMEGVFPNNKATVVFPVVGQKQLLLRFAKLKIV